MPYKERRLKISIQYKIFKKQTEYRYNKEFYDKRIRLTVGHYIPPYTERPRIEIYLDNIMHFYRDDTYLDDTYLHLIAFLISNTIFHELCHHFIKDIFPYSEGNLEQEEIAVERMCHAMTGYW